MKTADRIQAHKAPAQLRGAVHWHGLATSADLPARLILQVCRKMIQLKGFSSKLLLALFGIVLQESAHAQYARADGEFSSDKTEVRLLLLDGDKGVVAASVSVGMSPCSGAVAGIGSVRQRKIEFRPYESVQGGEKCRVALEFDSKWVSLKISDNGECHQFHGASCSWDGDVVKRKRK